MGDGRAEPQRPPASLLDNSIRLEKIARYQLTAARAASGVAAAIPHSMTAAALPEAARAWCGHHCFGDAFRGRNLNAKPVDDITSRVLNRFQKVICPFRAWCGQIGGQFVFWPSCQEPPDRCKALRCKAGHGGGRTHMTLRSTDFKSVASTDSATRPGRAILRALYSLTAAASLDVPQRRSKTTGDQSGSASRPNYQSM